MVVNLPVVETSPSAQSEQEQKVAALRALYVAGRINEVLIPERPDLRRLLEDVFPERRR